MEKKYIVTLIKEERERLTELINKGKVAGYKIKHANILLKADEGEYGPGWADVKIAEAFGVHETTVRNIRIRFIEKGIKTALEREKRNNYAKKLDGDTEAQLIAIACSNPPEGYSKWSVRLLADKMVKLQLVEEISHMTVQRTLKKINLSLGSRNNGAYRKHQENL
jgi:transposase